MIKKVTSTVDSIDHHTLAARLLFIAVMTFTINAGKMFSGWYFLCLAIAIGSFVFDSKGLKSPWMWGSFAVIHIGGVLQDYYYAANHHFLLCFATLIFAIAGCLPAETSRSFLTKNARYLIVVLLFFVSIQKLFSPLYMNGEFFAYMMLDGNLRTPS